MYNLGMSRNAGSKHHSPETREIAFQVWLFKASQSPARTARILATEEYGEISLTPETIAYWRDTEGWTSRVQDAARSIAGGLHVQAVIDQMAAGPESFAFLRAVVNGEIEGADPKTRVTAAGMLLDRSGYSPLGRTSKPTISGPSSLPSMTDLSVEEAARYERMLVDGMLEE